jgi:hypothetical protein
MGGQFGPLLIRSFLSVPWESARTPPRFLGLREGSEIDRSPTIRNLPE